MTPEPKAQPTIRTRIRAMCDEPERVYRELLMNEAETEYTADINAFTGEELTLVEVWVCSVAPEPGWHVIGRESPNPLVVHIDEDHHVTPQRRCKWFARCERAAVTTRPHPILTSVPCCQNCAKFVDDNG